MIAWLQRMRRRVFPAVIIELDVFTPSGQRAVIIDQRLGRPR